jgi:hypothetical protein
MIDYPIPKIINHTYDYLPNSLIYNQYLNTELVDISFILSVSRLKINKKGYS